MSSGRYTFRNRNLQKGIPAVEGCIVVAVFPGFILGCRRIHVEVLESRFESLKLIALLNSCLSMTEVVWAIWRKSMSGF